MSLCVNNNGDKEKLIYKIEHITLSCVCGENFAASVLVYVCGKFLVGKSTKKSLHNRFVHLARRKLHKPNLTFPMSCTLDKTFLWTNIYFSFWLVCQRKAQCVGRIDCEFKNKTIYSQAECSVRKTKNKKIEKWVRAFWIQLCCRNFAGCDRRFAVTCQTGMHWPKWSRIYLVPSIGTNPNGKFFMCVLWHNSSFVKIKKLHKNFSTPLQTKRKCI